MKHSRRVCAFLLALLADSALFAAPFRDCQECPLMTTVPAGTFDMGSTAEQLAAAGADVAENGDEAPLHSVTLAKPFAVGVNEVTRGEFARFIAESGYRLPDECQVVRDGKWQMVNGVSWKAPGFAQDDDHPVVCVSWLDASRYLEWLHGRSGRTYRLLSEAEWEYVARRGNAGRQLGPAVANYELADGWEFTAPVGTFGADSLELHDVLGNVWEWLEDCYHDSYDGAPADGRARLDTCTGKRSVRGGSYGDPANLLRLAYRLRGPQDGRYATLGFRIARDLN